LNTLNITNFYRCALWICIIFAPRMNTFFLKISIAICFCVYFFSGCNNLEQVQKNPDHAFKLTKANDYFAKKKYEEANVLYEELLTVYKGTKSFEDIYYKYAYSFYNMHNYIAASYHFKNFTDIFPNSAHREECEYNTCLCLYEMSPDATLDQGSTIKAIGALQTFINTHPESPKVADAVKIIDIARRKLETKDAENAALYFKIGEYKSAITAFKELIKVYPESENADYYLLQALRSSMKYAENSVVSKQKERYNESLVYYTDLVTNYPNSKHKATADKLKSTIFAIQNK
jgi:outer membrane protein assembly factor BamD